MTGANFRGSDWPMNDTSQLFVRPWSVKMTPPSLFFVFVRKIGAHNLSSLHTS